MHMIKLWMRTVFTTLILLCSLCVLAGDAAIKTEPVKTQPPVLLQGTFIQLLNQHSTWKDEQWTLLFASLQKLGISHLLVQWSVYDQSAFYSGSQQFKSVANPPIDIILQKADKANIKVTIGLVNDADFWNKITQNPAAVESYLAQLQSRSLTAAKELAPLVKKYRSFRGWYIPQEVDDLNWRKPEAERVLFSYIQTLSSSLKPLSPNARISISGFANAGTDPEFLEKFWKKLLQASPAIDALLFQDGVGVGKLKPDTTAPYFHAVKNATGAESRDLAIVIEVFRQVSGQPIDKGPFRAVPTSLELINTQLNGVAPYSSEAIAFSIPEYMSPVAGAPAKELFEAYLSRYNAMLLIKK